MGTDHQSVYSQWHVTIQRCSAARALKLSGTEKLIPCHRGEFRCSTCLEGGPSDV